MKPTSQGTEKGDGYGNDKPCRQQSAVEGGPAVEDIAGRRGGGTGGGGVIHIDNERREPV